MPAFVSPLASPSSWTYSTELVTLPPGVRYPGYVALGLRARSTADGGVVFPAQGAARSVDAGALHWIELQPSPFAIRSVLGGLRMGLPTFYFAFAAPRPALAADTAAAQGAPIATATSVLVAVVGQDRVALDPAAWCDQILGALRAGGTPTEWEPFATAVAAALAPPGEQPVMLYDHTGAPLSGGSFEITGSTGRIEVVLTAADGGNLVSAARRAGTALPWALGSGLRVRDLGFEADQHVELAAFEDGAHATGALDIAPARRHFTAGNLRLWFAPQRGPGLAHYTRGNRIRFVQNGKPFFDEWFRLLATSDVTGGGVHLAGWAMFNEYLTERREGEPIDLPVNLEQLLQRIHAAGGTGRFLPTRFFQLNRDSALVPVALLLVFGLAMLPLVIDPRSFNDAGIALYLAALVGALVGGAYIAESQAHDLEPNRLIQDRLNAIDPLACALSAYPSIVADNPRGMAALTRTPVESRWILDAALSEISHLSVYHQKFSILRTTEGGAPRHCAYYGGIDFVSQQLDDVHHLAAAPFHDIQARVDGPAVRDLALSFEQRWLRDGNRPSAGAPPTLAFPTPSTDALAREALPDTPPCAMQVARSYFAAAAPARALEFAPGGDRTLLDTILAALGQAREYIYLQDQYLTPPEEFQRALFAALPRIKQLIVTVPGQTDVPFGDLARGSFIEALRLRARDAGTPLRIGYPRRHPTLPGTRRAAAAGRLFLARALGAGAPSTLRETIILKPAERIPPPPFWIVCDGELMRVDTVTRTTGTAEDERTFFVWRGVESRLMSSPADATAPAPRPRDHAEGAPVAVVDLTPIYVHCKLILVDDVFLSHGSANCNRRGYYSDGELNVFTVPQALRSSPANPLADLRRRIWLEMYNLPDAMAPLADDPVAALPYFDRAPLLGNRYTTIDWRPEKLTWSAGIGDSALALALQLLLFSIETGFDDQINRIAGDPSTSLEVP